MVVINELFVKSATSDPAAIAVVFAGEDDEQLVAAGEAADPCVASIPRLSGMDVAPLDRLGTQRDGEGAR